VCAPLSHNRVCTVYHCVREWPATLAVFMRVIGCVFVRLRGLIGIM
jgi:hypothetical protein